MSNIAEPSESSASGYELRRLLPLLVVFAVVAILALEARHINLRHIQHQIAGVAPTRLLLLGLGGLIASAAMGWYDVLAARVIGYQRRTLAGLRMGLMVSGINNVASLSGLTGSGLRVLLLTSDGVATAAAARYAGMVVAASTLGLSGLALATLATRPAILAATPLPDWVVLIALAVVACYLPLYLLLATTPLLRIGRLAADS